MLAPAHSKAWRRLPGFRVDFDSVIDMMFDSCRCLDAQMQTKILVVTNYFK